MRSQAVTPKGTVAIDASAERRNQRNAVLASFLGWTFDAFDFFVLTFLIADIAKAFGELRQNVAFTLTLTLAMRPVGALIFGVMADRYGRRLPMTINIVFYAVMSALSGLAPTFRSFLMVGAIIGGLVIGYCSDRFGRRRAMIGALFGALLIVPLWIAAPSSGLIVLGGFLMQFCVQGAWGVIPAHMNELSPGHLRGFLPGFAYQLGMLCAGIVPYLETVLGEHFTYAQSMGFLAATALGAGMIVIGLGPEAHGITFRKRPVSLTLSTT